jgi:hypothetical protein
MGTREFDDVRDRGDGQRTGKNKLELDDMRDRSDALRTRVSALREAKLPPVASPPPAAPRQKTTVPVAQPAAARRDAPARSKLLPAI